MRSRKTINHLKGNHSLSTETGRRRRRLILLDYDSSEYENLASETAHLEITNRMERGEQVAASHPTHNVDPTPQERGDIGSSSKMDCEHVNVNNKPKNDRALIVFKCIWRFVYEECIDLNCIKQPSFRRMIDAIRKCGTQLKEVQEQVERVKRTWGTTGCSILLDGWTDQRGRNLISFIVDCPQGSIFLRSVDASDIVSDTDALFSLLSGVVEELGIYNVVQVIAHDHTCAMEAAGKKLVNKYKTVFWSLCADHCINLILERIGTLDHVQKVLNDAKKITRFIYSNPFSLALLKVYVRGKELVQTSKFKSVAPFITLQNMMSERENLMHMFNSSTWNMSTCSSFTDGKAICELVKKPSFWTAAADILRVTNPLIDGLHQINGSDSAPMGFIFNYMDRMKEEIEKNLGDEKVKCEPYWNIIDEVWERLHSPLHHAGYYLNPSLFYSNNVYVDAEITEGLLFCFVHMMDDQHQEMAAEQLRAYRYVLGGFAEEMAVDQRSKVPPASWWSSHGGQVPELQKAAVRILSQTCTTAARYKLSRSLSEKLHRTGTNRKERQMLADMEFVHNNLLLWNTPYSKDQPSNFGTEDRNFMDDWTGDFAFVQGFH